MNFLRCLRCCVYGLAPTRLLTIMHSDEVARDVAVSESGPDAEVYITSMHQFIAMASGVRGWQRRHGDRYTIEGGTSLPANTCDVITAMRRVPAPTMADGPNGTSFDVPRENNVITTCLETLQEEGVVVTYTATPT